MAWNVLGTRTTATRWRADPATYSRRSIFRRITVLALSLGAGCTSLADLLDGEPGEITVFNNTDSNVQVTIEVADRADGRVALAETTTIESSDAVRFNDVFEAAARYRFAVETDHGVADAYEWALPSTDHYLYVIIRSDAIEFEEMGP